MNALDERTRIQEFIDARYSEDDIRHSFETDLGQAIDCVDYYAQPGAKALAELGVELPEPTDDTSIDRSQLPDYLFNGKPDANGRARACPSGSVPIVRLLPESIRAAGGLDNYRNRPKAHATFVSLPVATHDDVPGVGTPGTYHVSAGYTGGQPILSGGTTTAIFSAPNAVVPGRHNLSQVFFSNGPETLEFGWIVDPGILSNTVPAFFTYTTSDGYKTGCWDGRVDSNCATWMGDSGAAVAPGLQLPSSTVNGAQIELTMQAIHFTGGWALYATTGGTIARIGRYMNFKTQLANVATSYAVWGEVQDGAGTFSTAMGSGAVPAAGYKQSGYHRNYWRCNSAGSCADSTSSFTLSSDNSAYYNSSTTPAAGTSQWGNYFYYGDAPRVFWGQDFADFPAPVGDWNSGSYKGNCDQYTNANGANVGEPVMGLSSYTSGSHQAHAVLCETKAVATDPTVCQRLTVAQVDNRRTTDNGWDWDPGFVKAECDTSNFVQSVSQSTSGELNGLLCCTTNQLPANRNGCTAQVFYGHDSPAHDSTRPDWDYSFYKGECPPGQFVAGVSKIHASADGFVGAPHALLCCPM